jgi:hypothetical protein
VKRSRILKKVLGLYNDIAERHRDRSPHAIAHSFGTYLLSSAIQKYPGVVALDRVIFFGSVINAEFGWKELAEAGGVKAIRNETGQRDHVSLLAGCAFWIRGMGNSGMKGFSGNATCVENVPYSEFRHSDAAELRKHINESWLPFLWGIPPD